MRIESKPTVRFNANGSEAPGVEIRIFIRDTQFRRSSVEELCVKAGSMAYYHVQSYKNFVKKVDESREGK